MTYEVDYLCKIITTDGFNYLASKNFQKKKPNYVYVAISLNFNKFFQLSSWEPITEVLTALA